MPIHLTAYTPCFRSEAGSYGKDTRGLIRQHQFHKVELVKLTRPEDSYDELEALTRDAEAVLEELGLPYRTVLLSTGDHGIFGGEDLRHRSLAAEPEDLSRDFLLLQLRGVPGAPRAGYGSGANRRSKPEFAHTLNGSGLAIGRTWLAILENYQQAGRQRRHSRGVAALHGRNGENRKVRKESRATIRQRRKRIERVLTRFYARAAASAISRSRGEARSGEGRWLQLRARANSPALRMMAS